MVLLLIPFASYCQRKTALNIGDTLPSIIFKNVFNDPGKTVSLSDYRGKLIILDFWNKWCHACLTSFPEMEKLQQRFGDTIKIFLVTNDSNGDLSRLFQKVKLPAIPILCNDTLLTNMFPHTTVPHHIWIGTQGKVQFITDGFNATENNISKVLEGENLALHIRKEVGDFKADDALWKEGNGRLQKYITGYSFGMNRIEENESTKWSLNKDTVNKTIGFKFLNVPLLDLYKMAFGNSIYRSIYKYNNRILFNLSDKGKQLRQPPNTENLFEWNEKNLVCFESKWLETRDSVAFQYLQNDVNKFFPYSVKTANKDILCYSLKLAFNKKIKKTDHEKPLIKFTDDAFILKNIPVSFMVESLNGISLFKDTPVIDGTNLNKNINIIMLGAFTDMVTLKQKLLENGFILEQERKILKMLIISEK